MKQNIFIKIPVAAMFLTGLFFFTPTLQKVMADEPTSSLSIANLERGEKFLMGNRKKPGIVVRESGLQYEVIKEGKGPKPRIIDQVEVHYEGTLIDGTVFDSSIKRGQPARFPVRGVIRGWVEALLQMNEGSRWRLFIPARLAYGEDGAGKLIGPNETLIFDVELIRVIK